MGIHFIAWIVSSPEHEANTVESLLDFSSVSCLNPSTVVDGDTSAPAKECIRNCSQSDDVRIWQTQLYSLYEVAEGTFGANIAVPAVDLTDISSPVELNRQIPTDASYKGLAIFLLKKLYRLEKESSNSIVHVQSHS